VWTKNYYPCASLAAQIAASVDTVDMSDTVGTYQHFVRMFDVRCLAWSAMSVLDDFVRMRRYRDRAAEFELLADAAAVPGLTSLLHHRTAL
jgi:hypothetical protein